MGAQQTDLGVSARARTPAPTRRNDPSAGVGRPRTRLAIVTPWHPEPVDNGSKQRIRQLIVALADTYDIVLISLLTADQRAGTDEPPRRVPGVWQQHSLPLPEYRARTARALLASLAPMPRSFGATWDPATAASINRIVRESRVDIVIGADLRVLRYLLALPPGLASLLDEANLSPFIAPAGQRCSPAALRARAREYKYARLLRAGARVLSAAIVSSQPEARAYHRLADSERVAVIENSVGAFPSRAWRPPAGAQLLYTGAIGYGPNADAVAYFAREILPQIVLAEPDARLIVTGAIPQPLPPGIADRHVALTGSLDAEALAATYGASRVCVVPLRAGTGTRIKLLEALARGIPIVTTTKGMEGLEVTDGEHLLVADTPAAFAAATLRLLRDTALATRLGAQGREHVRRRYSWEARGQELRALVAACLTTKRDGEC